MSSTSILSRLALNSSKPSISEVCPDAIKVFAIPLRADKSSFVSMISSAKSKNLLVSRVPITTTFAPASDASLILFHITGFLYFMNPTVMIILVESSSSIVFGDES